MSFLPNSEKERDYNQKERKNKLIFSIIRFLGQTKLRIPLTLQSHEGFTLYTARVIFASSRVAMLDSSPDFNNKTSNSYLSELCEWLTASSSLSKPEELAILHGHLQKIKATDIPPQQRFSILEKLYVRSFSSIEALYPALTEALLPTPGKTRQTIRIMQDVLKSLADNLLDFVDNTDNVENTERQNILIWRSLTAVSRHLLIGSLIAAPAGTGIWQLLHRIYTLAQQKEITRKTPGETNYSLHDAYYAAVLLGCASPASFSTPEISFLNAYLERFSCQIDSNGDIPAQRAALFWIDPARDAPATPYLRKHPPPETTIRYFSCNRLAALLRQQLSDLETGTLPEEINLPRFAATPTGQSMLHRLSKILSTPGKRRFPRRRQNYSGKLCFGLNNIYLLQKAPHLPVEISTWMITNESPDGYTAMHVSGKTGAILVGDVAALKAETGNNWQLCIIRWAQSGNPEHLELGLQILSARAIGAKLAVAPNGKSCQPALFLPAIPSISCKERIVVPTGILPNYPANLLLILEQDNIVVREVSTGIGGNDERNCQIEIFTIEPTHNEG